MTPVDTPAPDLPEPELLASPPHIPGDYDPYSLAPEAVCDPPRTLWSSLRQTGPGIILAGSVVGSGELIATTKLGAEHGYLFLWLILFSCVIKVFVQIELGRYAISSARPTLDAIDDLPGPRLGANWLVWSWMIMMMLTVFQLGAMTGGVGQALHMAFPQGTAALQGVLTPLIPGLAGLTQSRPELVWGLPICLTAIALLLSGGYQRIEFLTTVLVVSVTALTLLCVLALPATEYAIKPAELLTGFEFQVPAAGLALAFAVFGITGVGATELYAYPYWCIEKGYARAAGKRDDSPEWAARARGWIRVMQLDAWASMLVFTVTTLAFYLMGAAVLHPQGLLPDDSDMIATLSRMYIGPYGAWTQPVFLVGASAVLFKTLYVASAGHSRLMADFCSLCGWVRFRDGAHRSRWITGFCVFFPILALVLLIAFQKPTTMITYGAIAQAVTLPMISIIAIYFRYYGTDPRVAPSRVWDVFLITAAVLISLVAVYFVVTKVGALVQPAGPKVVQPAAPAVEPSAGAAVGPSSAADPQR